MPQFCDIIIKTVGDQIQKLNENFTTIAYQLKEIDKKLDDEPVVIKKDQNFQMPTPISDPEQLVLLNSKLVSSEFMDQMVSVSKK